jgi:hypothetical protein
MRAAVVEAVPAGGRAEIVRDDAAGNEASDFQPGKLHEKDMFFMVSPETFGPSNPGTLVSLIILNLAVQ